MEHAQQRSKFLPAVAQLLTIACCHCPRSQVVGRCAAYRISSNRINAFQSSNKLCSLPMPRIPPTPRAKARTRKCTCTCTRKCTRKHPVAGAAEVQRRTLLLLPVVFSCVHACASLHSKDGVRLLPVLAKIRVTVRTSSTCM